jgi:hypothetical protein
VRFRAIFNTNDRYHPLLEKHDRWWATARILKLSKRARLLLEWIIYYHAKANKSAALTARHFGIARKVFYDWFNRFDELNLASLEDRSRRPHTLRTKQYTPSEAIRIQELRRIYPTLGRDKLAVLYAEQYGSSIKPWSLRRIIHDYQLFAERAVRTKRTHGNGKPAGLRKKRIFDLQKQPFPGFLLEVDTIVTYFAGGKTLHSDRCRPPLPSGLCPHVQDQACS